MKKCGTLVLKVFIYCGLLILSSCAKFDLQLLSSGVTLPPFALTTPEDDDRFFRDTATQATGVCDENGGAVNITGTSITAPASGACAADGTFSIPITIVSSGEALDIHAEQTDIDGVLQTDSSVNLMVHCVQDIASELITCPVTGSGNPSDPYMMSNVTCLQEMRDGLNCYYALANDIDASATQTWNGGMGFEPVPLVVSLDPDGKFEGFFDGRGHTISNLHIEQRNDSGTGIFSKVFGNASPQPRVHDLIIDNASVEGYHKLGIIAGAIDHTVFENVQILNSEILATRPTNFVSIIGLFGGHLNGSSLYAIESRDSSIKLSMPTPGWNNFFKSIGGAVGYARGTIDGVMFDNVRIENESGSPNLGGYDGIGGLIGETESGSYNTINNARLNTTISLTSERVLDGGPIAFQNLGGLVGSGQASGERICNDTFINLNSSEGIQHVGGLIGDQADSNISRSENHIDIRLNESRLGIEYVGGAYGEARDGAALISVLTVGQLDLQSTNGGGTHLPIEHLGGLMGRYSGISGGFVLFHAGSFVEVTTTPDASTSTTKGGVLGSYIDSPNGGDVYYANDLANYSGVGSGSPLSYITGNTAAHWRGASATYNWDFVNYWMRPSIPSYPRIIACQ